MSGAYIDKMQTCPSERPINHLHLLPFFPLKFVVASLCCAAPPRLPITKPGCLLILPTSPSQVAVILHEMLHVRIGSLADTLASSFLLLLGLDAGGNKLMRILTCRFLADAD